MSRFLHLLLHRSTWLVVALVVQIAALAVVFVRFQTYFVYWYGIFFVLSMVVVAYVLSRRTDPAYKLAWVVPILLVPIVGGLLYLMFGGHRISPRRVRRMQRVDTRMQEFLPPPESAGELRIMLPAEDAAVQARYLRDYAFSPPYQHTYTEYFPVGEEQFEQMKRELRLAQRFIFLEYFIIGHGIMWDEILEILREKAAAGLDVRVIYDDFGCLSRLPLGYERQLRRMGIRCEVFNPLVPVLSSRANTRDHRKICVIDGGVGFTGGINLADEYINAESPLGHWKDTALMMRGEAVWSLTIMFLSMWEYLASERVDFNLFAPLSGMADIFRDVGVVQPYCDNPLDDESVGQTVYLNLINKAKRYVYITTPYLIPGDTLTTALCNAGKAGVDVRIITPHIPDKWYVHAVTRANYEVLIRSGVRIYEYTPGFMHAKMVMVDDEYASIGTVNMDYRSLFLHFECGVWLYRAPCILAMLEDYRRTLAQCYEYTLRDCRRTRWYTRLGRQLLRAFAPLM